MEYLGENIPKLGFGLMRLPMINKVIDVEQTKKMVDLFLESGFTYFDTAYGYNEGKSEETAKAAIIDRYPREKFFLATKLPAWANTKTADDAKNMFWTSLMRTGAEYFDFYLLHNIGATRTKSFDDFGIWDYALELKAKGLIHHIGFSFHDKAELLDEVLTKHPEMEFVQLQINYADWNSGTVQSRLCHEIARKHNKPIVIMEPVKGGMLASPAPPVKAVFDEAATGLSYSSWAIRFAASLEGVITVLSGMSSLEQMKDNVSYMKDFVPLNDSDLKVIEKAQKAFSEVPSIPCTACEYCLPGCPNNIVIHKILEMLNREMVYNDPVAAKFGYNWESKFGGKGSDCTECGKCEEVCPQQIDIIDLLKEATAKYEKV